MALETEKLAGAEATPPPLPKAMEGNGGTKSGTGDTGTSAADLAVAHKGLRGGRARLDGLVPGSEEAIEADKRYDRIRQFYKVPSNAGKIHPEEKLCCQAKREEYAKRREDLLRIAASNQRDAEKFTARKPEPLPPALPSAPASKTDAKVDGADISLDALADATANAIVLWRGTEIEPVLEELLALIRDVREYRRELKLRAAKFLPEEILEIAGEVKKLERLEKMICVHGSEVLAKLLNKAGISAEHKSEIFLSTAVLGLIGGEIRISRRIAKMIELRKSNPPQPTT